MTISNESPEKTRAVSFETALINPKSHLSLHGGPAKPLITPDI